MAHKIIHFHESFYGAGAVVHQTSLRVSHLYCLTKINKLLIISINYWSSPHNTQYTQGQMTYRKCQYPTKNCHWIHLDCTNFPPYWSGKLTYMGPLWPLTQPWHSSHQSRPPWRCHRIHGPEWHHALLLGSYPVTASILLSDRKLGTVGNLACLRNYLHHKW